MFNRPISQPFMLSFEQTGELRAIDSTGQPYFSSQTVNPGAAPYNLQLLDDGRLSIYNAEGPVWFSS